MPRTCPTRTHAGVAKDPSPYLEGERQALMRAADGTPFDEEGRLRSRVDELVAFARARGMRRIGVAFCVSLIREAQELGRRIRAVGLEATLVCCRVGAIDYSEIGLSKAHPERFAAICNPVAQARLLDAAKVDLVAQVGLCIGHDLVLQEECDAPVTTLVVKDRVTGHNPAAVRAMAVASCSSSRARPTRTGLTTSVTAGRPSRGRRRMAVRLVYVASMVALFLHLSHGIQSFFQTMGWNNECTMPKLNAFGKTVAFVLLVGYVSIPVTILAGILSK